MMDVKLLYKIHEKMCSVMDKPKDVMFGGVSVVLVGDLLQVRDLLKKNVNIINMCFKF